MNDSQYIKGLWEESPELVEQAQKSLNEFIKKLGPPVDQDEIFGNFVDSAHRLYDRISLQEMKPDLVLVGLMECHHSMDPAFNNLAAKQMGIITPIVVTGGRQFRGKSILYTMLDEQCINKDMFFTSRKEVLKPMVEFVEPVEKQVSRAPARFIDDKYIYRKGRK